MKTLYENKECECNLKIKKLRMVWKTIKTISITMSIFSILISASITTTFLPTMAIGILSICSVVLTGINLKFKFQDKNLEIRRLINKLNKIRLKLEYINYINYINSCNGNLSEHEYQELFRECINIV